MLTASIVWFVIVAFFMLAANDSSDRIYYGTIFAVPALVYLIAYIAGA